MKFSRINPILAAALTLAACLFLVVFSPAAGQEPDGAGAWSIRPADASGPDGRSRFSWDLDPGASLTDYVSVRNLGSEPLSLRVYASDAVTTPDGGFDVLPGDVRPEALGAWIALERELVDLAPGESVVIPFTVTVPANATPGDHPGGIVASLSRAADGEGGAVRLDYRVGLRAYLRVAGDLTPILTIENLRLDYSGSLNPIAGGETAVAYTVTNPGNVRLTATQRIRITGPLGVTLAESEPFEIPQVLPGQSYNASTTLTGVPPAFRLKAEVVLEPIVPGDAALSSAPVSASTSTLALPLSQLIVLALLAAAAAFFLRRRSQQRAKAVPAATPTPAGEAMPEFIKRLNAEYKEEILLVCRRAGGQPDATGAVVTGANAESLEIVASVEGQAVPVQVSWGQPLGSPLEMERQLLRLSRETPAEPEPISL